MTYPTLIVGGSRHENCPVVLRVDGADLLVLEQGNDGQALVTVDVFNADGEHVGKLVRNAWVFGGDGYLVETGPSALALTNEATGDTLVSANVLDRDTVEVTEARLHTPNGTLVTVVPGAGVQVGGLNLRGASSGAGVAIEVAEKPRRIGL